MKWGGMLIVSVRGVRFRFWSRLGCSEEKDIMCTSISSREGLVQGFTQRNIKIYI